MSMAAHAMDSQRSQGVNEYGAVPPEYPSQDVEGEDAARKGPPLLFSPSTFGIILLCAGLMACVLLVPMTWMNKQGETFKYRVHLGEVQISTLENAEGNLPKAIQSFESDVWTLQELSQYACNHKLANEVGSFYQHTCVLWTNMESVSSDTRKMGYACIALLLVAASMHLLLSFVQVPRFSRYVLLAIEVVIPFIFCWVLSYYYGQSKDFRKLWPPEGDARMASGFRFACFVALLTTLPTFMTLYLTEHKMVKREEDSKQQLEAPMGGVQPPWEQSPDYDAYSAEGNWADTGSAGGAWGYSPTAAAAAGASPPPPLPPTPTGALRVEEADGMPPPPPPS
mmetsp:Transcript_76429/g.181801  ORF Transcript_76429/g.181801 Transcript_76429/m.181801 type:complete len:339 (-) Transcript_76429:50-1066(-)